jgi:hypothetical protein
MSSNKEALEYFCLALQAFAANDFQQAVAHCSKSRLLDPQSRVYAAAQTYLQRILIDGKQSVYINGTAFGAFIRGGGNQRLYRATSAALQSVYREYTSLRLLEIGVGDGLAFIPAFTPNIQHVTLIEPSEAMLNKTRAAIQALGVEHEAFVGTLQNFISQQATFNADLAQATFSLESITPTERQTIFSWLKNAVKRLLIVEFDVPQFATLREQARFVVEQYEKGLAQYADDPTALVAQGFLLPVLFGYFDPSGARTNYEQPITHWITELQHAGFTTVQKHYLDNYWWSPAYLLDAISPAAQLTNIAKDTSSAC